MRTQTLKRLFGTAAIVLALGACKNESLGSDDNGSGDLSFTYTGAATGQFNASGEFNRKRTNPEFSAAVVEDGEIVFLAADKVQSNRTDVFLMSAPASVGTTTCTSATQFADCKILGFFAVGFTSPNDPEPDAQYVGFVGSIQVAELTDDRVRGTFSLLMEDENATTTLEARSGTFDLPIIPSSELAGNRSPLPAAVSLNRVLPRS